MVWWTPGPDVKAKLLDPAQAAARQARDVQGAEPLIRLHWGQTKQADSHSSGCDAQNAFLGEFGGTKGSDAKGKLLDQHPLPPDKRVMYNALSHIPEMGPAQAHAIAEEFGSFGNLMASLLDPTL